MSAILSFRADDHSANIWRVVQSRLEHLSLRVQSGTFSRDFFKTIRHCLTSFANAWSVTFHDGRHFLVPASKFKDESSAIAEAWKIACSLIGSKDHDLPAESPKVRRNGVRPLAELNSDDLMRWLVANPQWKSGHTKKNSLCQIVDTFLWFEEEHEIKSPYKRKHVPNFIRPARREAADAEYISLMRHTPRPIRRALWCLYWLQGIRPCEMRELLWSDFNFEGGFILKYSGKTVRKTGRPRFWALTAKQFNFFKRLHAKRDPTSDIVFPNSHGKPMTRSALARQIRAVARRAKLDNGVAQHVTAYCFRHTFATQADEAGILEQDTAMAMGIPDGKMLRTIYSKASRKVTFMRASAEKIESLRIQNRRARSPKKNGPTPLFDGLE